MVVSSFLASSSSLVSLPSVPLPALMSAVTSLRLAMVSLALLKSEGSFRNLPAVLASALLHVVEHAVHLVEGGQEFIVGIIAVDERAKAALAAPHILDDLLEIRDRDRQAIVQGGIVDQFAE